MKTAIDLPDKELLDAIQFTGAKTKKEALVNALAELNRRCRMARLAERLGSSDTFCTADEVFNEIKIS